MHAHKNSEIQKSVKRIPKSSLLQDTIMTHYIYLKVESSYSYCFTCLLSFSNFL